MILEYGIYFPRLVTLANLESQVSSQMKKINSSFGKWHGISALANLVMILALLYHGMWIANFGLRNKATKAGL